MQRWLWSSVLANDGFNPYTTLVYWQLYVYPADWQFVHKMPTLKGSNRSNGPRYQSPNLGRAFHSDGGKSSLLSAESPKSASYASDYTHLSSPTLTANYDPNSPQARIRNESYYASRLGQCIPSIANSSTRSRASTDTSTRPTSNYSNIRSPTQVIQEHDSNNCTSSNDVEDDFEDGVRFVDAYHGLWCIVLIKYSVALSCLVNA